MFKTYAELAERILAGSPLSTDDALAILRGDDADVMSLVAAAATLRRRYFGTTVKANYLVNLKSGLCPEDCTYCSQRLGSTADIPVYSWLKPDEAVEQAGHGINAGATRVCLVSSGRGPTNRSLKNFLRNVRLASRILKREKPDVIISTGAGICVPFFLLGRRRGIRTVYIESMARIESLSLTGKLVYRFSDHFLVQWPELAAKSGRAVYQGDML